MDPIAIIYSSLETKPPKMKKYGKKSKCFWCAEREGEISKKDAFGAAFTNFDISSNPTGIAVCEKCYCVLKEPTLRKSCWISSLNNPILYFKREQASDVIFNKNKHTPFVMYVTTSFKKLGQIKASTSFSPINFDVQFEEISVKVDLEKHKQLWDTIEYFYSMPESEKDKKQPKSYFTKAEMRSGNYQLNRIQNYGVDKWCEQEKVLANYRNSGIMELFLYIVNQKFLGDKIDDTGK